MKPKSIKINQNFIGRHYEIKRLEEITGQGRALILVVYDRRRVGKAEK